MLEIYNETCFINNRCMHPAVSLHAYRLQLVTEYVQLVTEYGSRGKQQVEIIPLSTPKILSSL